MSSFFSRLIIAVFAGLVVLLGTTIPVYSQERTEVLVTSASLEKPAALEMQWRIRQRVGQEEAMSSLDVAPLLGTKPTVDPIRLREVVVKARTLYKSMDYGEARSVLLGKYEAIAAFLSPRSVRWCLSTLAWLQSAVGKPKKAVAAYELLLRFFPDFTLDPKRASPSVRRQFERGRRRARTEATGRLTVTLKTQTQGAVFIDGRYIGVTPIQDRRVPAGLHIVRVSADGLIPWVGRVRVRKNRSRHLKLRLKSTHKRHLFEEIRRRLPTQATSEQLPEAVRTLAALAAVRHIIVFDLSAERIWAALFDVNRQVVVRTTKIARDRLPLIALADVVIERLYEGLNRRSPSLVDAVIPVDGAIETRGTPWWVWLGVGVGAAAAIIIPTVILLDQPDGVPRDGDTGTVIVEF